MTDLWLAETVVKFVDREATGRTLAIFGEPTVNVLELNIVLEKLNP